MWRDICLENREAIAGRLDSFQDRIGELAALVRARDGAALHERFARAKGARDTYLEHSKR